MCIFRYNRSCANFVWYFGWFSWLSNCNSVNVLQEHHSTFGEIAIKGRFWRQLILSGGWSECYRSRNSAYLVISCTSASHSPQYTIIILLMWEFAELFDSLHRSAQLWALRILQNCGLKFFRNSFDKSVKVIKEFLCTCTFNFRKGVCTILKNRSVKVFSRIRLDSNNIFLGWRSSVRMYCESSGKLWSSTNLLTRLLPRTRF